MSQKECYEVLDSQGQPIQAKHTLYTLVVKRCFDLLCSGVGLILCSPLMLVCALAIKKEDGGPIFYTAQRMGYKGKAFKMYKFRSMKQNAPDLRTADGSTYNAADDPRLTKIGAKLRATSLDELPQLINVFLGSMSLIGPRPDDLKEAALYEGDEAYKLRVKPGITGYAQVYGRNSIPWKERLKLDLIYVDKISFLLDCKVFFRTFAVIFKQEGIYVEDERSNDSKSR